ncbi:MAG TPA: hypothetical protein VIE87_09100 [Pseudolabrys sp.]
MAFVARPAHFRDAVPYEPTPQAKPPRRSLWRRLYDAVMLAHERDAQREIERFVARRGKLTDSMEREIAERYMRG